jgi:uncharacterized protein (UPF0335 family)
VSDEGRYSVKFGERTAKVDSADKVRLEKLEEDVDEIKRDVKEVTAIVTEIRLKLAANSHHVELKKADKNHRSAVTVALVSLAGVVLTVLCSAVTAYWMRPEPQVVTAPLSPEVKEALKLLEQRDGYRMGQKPTE